MREPWLKLRPDGRGRNYSPGRGLMESALRLAYGPFGWPARLWGLVPAARRVRLVEHRLPLLPPRPGRRPLRVAFLSDLHLGPTTARATLDRAFELAGSLAPDLLLLGGDYVFLDATPALAAELTARVAALPAPVKLAVLGNHDLWTAHDRLERALARAGARVLVNEAARLPPPFDDVAVLGLDDPWTGAPDAAPALAACRGAGLTLALCHSPDGLAFARGPGVDLMLCGHTHGGQIALPGPRPLVLPPGPYSRRLPFGLHRVEGTWLFVSRGVGATELPVRAYAPPDVALFVLGPAGGGAQPLASSSGGGGQLSQTPAPSSATAPTESKAGT
ncbi:MAG TPA: metallophosphoesterase [Polyangiaceae bacterium]|nr:metallophosphoesterase [Polyangiaceae bacterium]